MNGLDSIWGVLGVIVLLAGVYAFYRLWKIRYTGELGATLLLGKDLKQKKCTDKEAYLKKIGPALTIFGVAAVAFGVIDTIHWYVYPMSSVDTAAMMIFFFVLVWFSFYTGKLKSRYFE